MRRGVRIRTCTHQPYSTALEPMDPNLEDYDDAVDNRLLVNDDEYQEAVGGQPADGAEGDGMPLEQEKSPQYPTTTATTQDILPHNQETTIV